MNITERRTWENTEGIIFDIQRYSLHDGPGLRTNVFFKGCPLRCRWCANPESQSPPPDLAVFSARCLRCGQFAEPCPEAWAAPDDSADWDTRAAHCPAGGVRWIGERRTAGSILEEVRRDAPFYEESGGLTLAGGEPTCQPTFAEALLRLAHDECIHTAMETCGHCPWPVFERLLPHLDAILFDVKHVDSAIHAQETGVGNALILSNLRRLARLGAPLTMRVPLIPGFNATVAAVRAIGEVIASLDGPVRQVDLLPYHTLGRAKYAALGRPYPWPDYTQLTDSQVEECAQILRDFGLSVTIGG